VRFTKSEEQGTQVFIGFTTTKGALVRSMLFPKPIGFKFYRDSIRFIMVLSGIAGLGFCVSAVQFVKLGVCALIYHPQGGI
jgi:cation-transporting P-type ATPase 13A2